MYEGKTKTTVLTPKTLGDEQYVFSATRSEKAEIRATTALAASSELKDKAEAEKQNTMGKYVGKDHHRYHGEREYVNSSSNAGGERAIASGSGNSELLLPSHDASSSWSVSTSCCAICQYKFNLLIRPHLCGHCHLNVCNACSPKPLLVRNGERPKRVCKRCAGDITRVGRVGQQKVDSTPLVVQAAEERSLSKSALGCKDLKPPDIQPERVIKEAKGSTDCDLLDRKHHLNGFRYGHHEVGDTGASEVLPVALQAVLLFGDNTIENDVPGFPLSGSLEPVGARLSSSIVETCTEIKSGIVTDTPSDVGKTKSRTNAESGSASSSWGEKQQQQQQQQQPNAARTIGSSRSDSSNELYISSDESDTQSVASCANLTSSNSQRTGTMQVYHDQPWLELLILATDMWKKAMSCCRNIEPTKD